MIEIDGSIGEGGGQILRTSVAFSAVMQEPVRVVNIRAKRKNPGLRAQHMNAIKAVAELCNAKTKGVGIGSGDIEFIPGKIKTKKLNIDIGTAGSITLVLQALMIPAVYTKEILEIKIRGGTDVKLSPSIDYLRFVTLPILKKLGYTAEIELIRRGYYPAGGGLVIARIYPAEELKRINLPERGKILSIKGISHAHKDLQKAEVAERQAGSARRDIFNKITMESKIQKEYADALSYGSGITLYAETEDSILGSDAPGEKGKKAEIVGNEAAEDLINEILSNAPIDKHMTDQIIPYLALAKGSVLASEITRHALTNIEIVKKFGFDLRVDGNIISH